MRQMKQKPPKTSVLKHVFNNNRKQSFGLLCCVKGFPCSIKLLNVGKLQLLRTMPWTAVLFRQYLYGMVPYYLVNSSFITTLELDCSLCQSDEPQFQICLFTGIETWILCANWKYHSTLEVALNSCDFLALWSLNGALICLINGFFCWPGLIIFFFKKREWSKRGRNIFINKKSHTI